MILSGYYELRLQIATLLLDAKADLGAARPGEAELKCTDALVRCDELADKRASRAVLRVMVGPFLKLGLMNCVLNSIRRGGRRNWQLTTLLLQGRAQRELVNYSSAIQSFNKVIVLRFDQDNVSKVSE